MKKYSQWSILALAFLMLLILTTACGISGLQAAASTATPESPLALLKASQSKMNSLHSLAMSGNDTTNATSTDTGETDTQMTLSGEAAQSPVSVSLQINGSVVTQGTSIPLALAMIIVDQQGYIQNTKNNGPWYSLSNDQGKQLLGGGIGSLGTKNQTNLLNTITASDITDHGLETLNGKKLRHLTITVTNSNTALKKAYLESTGDFANLTPDQLNSIKLQTGTEDYWIDPTTLYTYQQSEHYIVQDHIDTTGTITASTPNLTQNQTLTLMYSSFNVPVSITAPANAQPLQSILDLVS